MQYLNNLDNFAWFCFGILQFGLMNWVIWDQEKEDRLVMLVCTILLAGVCFSKAGLIFQENENAVLQCNQECESDRVS